MALAPLHNGQKLLDEALAGWLRPTSAVRMQAESATLHAAACLRRAPAPNVGS